MAKRHGLVLFLFCFSVLVGLAAAFPGVIRISFFPYGALVLLIAAAVLFAAAAFVWLALRRKHHTRDPRQSLLYQGTAFGTWFIIHNLSWALAGCILVWGLFTLFGFSPWVLIFSAGSLACTCFALTGSFFIRFKQRSMLGLCWRSPIPDGLANFWDHAAATMILRDRFEYAADYDQKQPTPVLWSISRVFDRSAAEDAERRVDLMEHDSPKNKFKSEEIHRLKVLTVLFLVTTSLAILPGLLGLTPPPWDRVPDGWPSAKNQQMTANKQNQNQEQKSKEEEKQKGKSKQSREQEQKGKESGSEKKDETRQDKGSGKEDQGQSQEKKQESKGEGKQKGKSDQSQGQEESGPPGEGGTKQGLGDPNHVPETLPEPESIPKFPSRDTEMVTLDLPTLTPTTGKGDPKKDKGEPDTDQKKQPAPITQFKEGKQDPRISKPDQFLPNWIRMLMRTTKDNKSKK